MCVIRNAEVTAGAYVGSMRAKAEAEPASRQCQPQTEAVAWLRQDSRCTRCRLAVLELYMKGTAWCGLKVGGMRARAATGRGKQAMPAKRGGGGAAKAGGAKGSKRARRAA